MAADCKHTSQNIEMWCEIMYVI